MNPVPPAFPEASRAALAVVLGAGAAARAAAAVLAGVDCALRLAAPASDAPGRPPAAAEVLAELQGRWPRVRAAAAPAEDAAALTAGAGVVLLAEPAPTLWDVHDAAVRAGVPAVALGAGAGALSLVTVRPGRDPCLRCLFDGVAPAAEAPGPESPAVAALLGALAGAEALRLVRGAPPAYAGRPLRHAPIAGWARASPVRARARCALCGGGAP